MPFAAHVAGRCRQIDRVGFVIPVTAPASVPISQDHPPRFSPDVDRSEDFAVPHTALRLWRAGAESQPGGRAETSAVSDRIREYAQELAQPFCGPSGNVEAAAWFGEAAPHVRSIAHIALSEPGPAGTLIFLDGDSYCIIGPDFTSLPALAISF